MREASDTYMITVVKMRNFSELDEGKKWFICWLNNNNFTDIIDTDSISQFCHWDVEAKYGNDKYIFELKNRTFESTKYNDTAINYDKYEHLLNSPYRAVLVTFWTDCWLMLDIKVNEPDNTFIKKCSHQTRFADHTMINKKMVSWNIRNKKLLQYD